MRSSSIDKIYKYARKIEIKDKTIELLKTIIDKSQNGIFAGYNEFHEQKVITYFWGQQGGIFKRP